MKQACTSVLGLLLEMSSLSVIYHVTCLFNSCLGELTVAVLVTDGLEFEPVLGGSWLFMKNLWSRSINPFRAVPLQKRIGTWNLIVGPDLFLRNSSIPVLLEELGNCSSSSLEDTLNSSSWDLPVLWAILWIYFFPQNLVSQKSNTRPHTGLDFDEVWNREPASI